MAEIYGILDKNRNFGQKSKFWTKIEILDKNRNFRQKSKFWTKIELLNKTEILNIIKKSHKKIYEFCIEKKSKV